MALVINCPPSKRIKAADGIGLKVKGTGTMPPRIEANPVKLSKNARRKAERYGNTVSMGKIIGTALSRKVCRLRYTERLNNDFNILVRYKEK